MIVIDTSAWIEFFKRGGDPGVKTRVADLINLDQAVLTCPVEFELLTGAKASERNDLETAFSFVVRVEFKNAHWVAAAELAKDLLKRGVTVPRDDVFVAALATVEGLPILTVDNHFQLMRDKGGAPLTLE